MPSPPIAVVVAALCIGNASSCGSSLPPLPGLIPGTIPPSEESPSGPSVILWVAFTILFFGAALLTCALVLRCWRCIYSPARVDMARHKPAASSSQESDETDASNCVDGDPTTFWCSGPLPVSGRHRPWIGVDLQESVRAYATGLSPPSPLAPVDRCRYMGMGLGVGRRVRLRWIETYAETSRTRPAVWDEARCVEIRVWGGGACSAPLPAPPCP